MNRHPADMSHRSLLVAGLVVALAACAGPDTSAFEDDSMPAAVPTSSPQSTDPPATTVATTIPPTTAAASTVAPTTLPPSTVAPSTTVVSEEDRVRAAIEAHRVGELDCMRVPATCDPSSFSARDHLVSLRRRAEEFTESGFYLGDGPSPIVYRIDTVTVDGPNSSASACVFDPAVVFGPPLADGTPVVVNDLQLTRQARFELVKDGGKWFVSRVDYLDEGVEGNQCV